MPSVPPRRPSSLRLAVFSLALLLVGLPCASAAGQTIGEAAQRQVSEVNAFKASFTPAEKKMSFTLVLASRAAQGKPLGALARFLPGTPGPAGTLDVEVSGQLSPSLLTSTAMRNAETIDGQVPSSALAAGRARAHVTPAQLLELASHPDVTAIRQTTGARTNVGSATSQGYIAHRANQVVASGVNGAGVRVGVLSDSATPARVAALIASGDLPSNTVVLPGQADYGFPNPSDEGTAMMEIIHDVAPGAQLFFATAFTGEPNFADNIRKLRFQYHCDIIVDDISYLDEPVFQDGIVAQAVNDITVDGGLYVSSAANSGNLDSGTSGTWEGDFTAVRGLSFLGEAVHNFAPAGSPPQFYDVLTVPAYSGVYLQWSDAFGKSANDYDLFIFDSTLSVLKGVSGAVQDGTQDPFEFIQPGTGCGTATASGYCPAAGDLVLVGLYNGSRRALHLDTERAQLSIGTAGATFGHNAARNTVSLAATYWNSAHTGVRPFDGVHNPVETFSSDGPRKIFYRPDGTPFTTGRYLFSNNGGATLQKPDVTAADGVTCRTPGFSPFFGTSAAAPHAAGIAALVKSANPRLNRAQILSILRTTALDNGAPGVDRDGGYGILNAPSAVAAGQALPR